VIATPLPGRLRLSGTLELAGMDTSISRVRVDAIRRAAARVLAIDHERAEVDVWAGLRPCTPDGLPVIGRPSASSRSCSPPGMRARACRCRRSRAGSSPS
jgi:glycine/D-amino acid oxidase-like deaminating enzyme